MEEKKENWKVVTMILGGLIGLASGVIAAYILIQRAEEEESRPRISPGEGVKVGLGVLGVLRIISDLATKH
jgi:hypothetical protein